MLPRFIRATARRQDPYVHSHGGPSRKAAKPAWGDIACLWLIYRFIWINSCVRGTNRPLRCCIYQTYGHKKEIKIGFGVKIILTLPIDASSPWIPYQFNMTSPFYLQKCRLLLGVQPAARRLPSTVSNRLFPLWVFQRGMSAETKLLDEVKDWG